MFQPDELSQRFQEALAGPHERELLQSATSSLALWMGQERQLVVDALAKENEATRLAIELESSELLDAFDTCLDWLNLVADYQRTHSQERIDAARQHWQACWNQLQFCRLAHSDAIWSMAGPIWHPGINRLLQLEDVEEIVQAELERCHAWQQRSTSGDEEHGLALFYERYQAALEGPLNDERLEELGHLHDRLDFDGLWRRYSGSPTSKPWLNLIIHGGWLFSQGRLHPSLLTRLQAMAEAQLVEQPNAEELADWLTDYLELLSSFDEQNYRSLVDEVLELEAIPNQ